MALIQVKYRLDSCPTAALL